MSSSLPSSGVLLLALTPFTLASLGNLTPNGDSSTLTSLNNLSGSVPLDNCDNFHNFTEIAGSDGYDVEEHKVTTDDGYILIAFRMSNRTCPLDKGTPVILLHGLLSSSDSFLDAGPGEGLAYQLADACLDLWVTNNRGNYYGRAHTKLNPDKDPQFWEFSVDEMGIFDAPAHVDYVINHTNYQALNFVSYSQGSAVFYIMTAARPEYRAKIKVHVGLAPVTRITNMKSKPLRLVARGASLLKPFLSSTGLQEFLPRGSVTQQTLALFCGLPDVASVTHEGCDSLLYILDSFHPGSISENTTISLYTHLPAGTSIRNMDRYGQGLDTPNFQMYDHGSKAKNLEVYGRETPPVYDLTGVDVPSVLIRGDSDNLLSKEDLDWLQSQLPRVLERKTVDEPLWNHFDNGFSSYSSNLIFPTIIKYLHMYI